MQSGFQNSLEKILFFVWRFRGLARARLFFSGIRAPYFVQRSLFGKTFFIDVSRSDAQKLLYLEGERFIEERFLVRRLVEGRKSLVDVGANIGYYLLIFSRYAAKDASILCIEPSIENLPELDLNIQLNNFDNVVLEKVAVGDKAGTVGLKTGINSGVTGQAEGVYQVDVLTLDQLIKGMVDFIKIDVEGYEYHVLQGARNVIAEYKPRLFVELHPKPLHNFGASVFECVQLLREYYSDIEFYVMPSSIGAPPKTKFARLLDRFSTLYLNRDVLEKVTVSDEQLATIDREHSWGTFWLVCG